jgi:hypothetical protein
MTHRIVLGALATLALGGCFIGGNSCRTYAPEQACVDGKVTDVWCGDTGWVDGGLPVFTPCGGSNAVGSACVPEGQSCQEPDGGTPVSADAGRPG